MLLNKLVNALNKVIERERQAQLEPESAAIVAAPSIAHAYQVDLQRRGEGAMYLRCYFNAVSCF